MRLTVTPMSLNGRGPFVPCRELARAWNSWKLYWQWKCRKTLASVHYFGRLLDKAWLGWRDQVGRWAARHAHASGLLRWVHPLHCWYPGAWHVLDSERSWHTVHGVLHDTGGDVAARAGQRPQEAAPAQVGASAPERSCLCRTCRFAGVWLQLPSPTTLSFTIPATAPLPAPPNRPAHPD